MVFHPGVDPASEVLASKFLDLAKKNFKTSTGSCRLYHHDAGGSMEHGNEEFCSFDILVLEQISRVTRLMILQRQRGQDGQRRKSSKQLRRRPGGKD